MAFLIDYRILEDIVRRRVAALGLEVLEKIATSGKLNVVLGDKGLLATDESNPTCNKRFAKLRIPQTEQARRVYRELMATTPGLGECIIASVLHPPTCHPSRFR